MLHTQYALSILHRCEELVPILHICENWKVNSSHPRKIEPVLRRWHEYVPIIHSKKWEICEIWVQMLDHQNYRNWPYANFTFFKSDVVVPILHTVWNLRHVKFAVQQCSLRVELRTCSWSRYGTLFIWLDNYRVFFHIFNCVMFRHPTLI